MTKIIVTLGVNSSTQEELVQLILAGMDVARISDRFLLNTNKTEVLRNLKAAMQETGRQVGVMLGLRESDIRFKTADPSHLLHLHEGDYVKVATEPITVPEGEQFVLCNNKEFPLLVRPNDKLLIDFGKIIFTVIDVESQTPTQKSTGDLTAPMAASSLNCKTRDNIIYKLNTTNEQQIKIESEVPSRSLSSSKLERPMRMKPKSPKDKKVVVCRVENECTFWAHKPVHISPADSSQPTLSITHEVEDISAIQWANENDIDFVVYKQVREKDDFVDMLRFSVPNAKKFVGIQSRESSDIYQDLLKMADGIVIGRGMLALETSLAHVCQLQKDITAEANSIGKPVIISTQILESMVQNTSPGVTEVMDVTNAVIDGCDALILTSETAYGLHPVKAVQACVRLCLEAESVIDYETENEKMLRGMSSISVIENICYCAVRSVLSIRANLIACITTNGTTALMISHFRPPCPILAITNKLKTVRQLRIIRGVYPAYCDETSRLDIALVNVAMELAVRDGLARSGDIFVYVSGGSDSFLAGDTSSLRICKDKALRLLRDLETIGTAAEDLDSLCAVLRQFESLPFPPGVHLVLKQFVAMFAVLPPRPLLAALAQKVPDLLQDLLPMLLTERSEELTPAISDVVALVRIGDGNDLRTLTLLRALLDHFPEAGGPLFLASLELGEVGEQLRGKLWDYYYRLARYRRIIRPQDPKAVLARFADMQSAYKPQLLLDLYWLTLVPQSAGLMSSLFDSLDAVKSLLQSLSYSDEYLLVAAALLVSLGKTTFILELDPYSVMHHLFCLFDWNSELFLGAYMEREIDAGELLGAFSAEATVSWRKWRQYVYVWHIFQERRRWVREALDEVYDALKKERKSLRFSPAAVRAKLERVLNDEESV